MVTVKSPKGDTNITGCRFSMVLRHTKNNNIELTPGTANLTDRSYFHKSFHVWRCTDAPSRHLAAHDVREVHDITQHQVVLDIQKTNALQRLSQWLACLCG